MGGTHPRFERTNGVFDGRAPDIRCVRHRLHPLLHSLNHLLMFPATDVTVVARRAFRLDGAFRTRRGCDWNDERHEI